MTLQINPRPGVAVAITDRFGEIACYDPNAYRRRDYMRNEKIREEERRPAGYAKGTTAYGEREDRRKMACTGQ